MTTPAQDGAALSAALTAFGTQFNVLYQAGGAAVTDLATLVAQLAAAQTALTAAQASAATSAAALATANALVATLRAQIAALTTPSAVVSAFTLPLPANVPLDPNSPAIVKFFYTGFAHNDPVTHAEVQGTSTGGISFGMNGPLNNGMAVYIDDGTTPLVPVTQGTNRGGRAPFPAGWPSALPIPTWAATNGPLASAYSNTGDWPFVLVVPKDRIDSTGKVVCPAGRYEIYQCLSVDTAGSAYVGTNAGALTGAAIAGGVFSGYSLSASWINYGDTVVTEADAKAVLAGGAIKHMLSFVSAVGAGPQHSPAGASDYGDTDPTGVKCHEGTIFRLPASWVPTADITDAFAKAVCIAIRDYGAVIMDGSGGSFSGLQCEGKQGQPTDYITQLIGNVAEYNVLAWEGSGGIPFSQLQALATPSVWPPNSAAW